MKRAFAIVLLPCVACATATGEVTRGEARFDAGTEAFVDADPKSWTGLYRDFFGPNGKASCAATNSCHGSAGQPGFETSLFVCNEKAACLESLKGESRLLRDTDKATPEKSNFYLTLRRREGDAVVGIMPKSPEYVFSADDLARISAWIAKGAPND